MTTPKKTIDQWFNNYEASKAGQKYQTVIENPTFPQIVSNIRASSVMYSLLFVGVAAGFGWRMGKLVRPQTMAAAVVLQTTGSFAICCQSSFQRLKGYSPNDVELKKYGITKKEIVEIRQKRKILSTDEMLKKQTDTYSK
eukprot:gene11338-4506_t